MNYKFCFIVFLLYSFSGNINGESIELKFKNTLTVVEINSGDQVNYQLENGRSVKINLISTKTEILFSTLQETKKGSSSDATIYLMECMLEIDGHNISLVRYVPVQQSFYEPYTVNGIRIWFDGLRSLSQFFNENHGECLPGKEARFGLMDARFPICPLEMTNWVALPNQKLLVKDAYSGEDTWLGTYFGSDLHGGLDINMPNNTALYAPIDFDQHYYFNSLKAGNNNNRWRGVKKWSNGDTWYLQTHHLNQLLVPEHQPIEQGQKYAYTAGTWVGHSPHTHFVFKLMQPGFEEYFMDPWLIFWQIFQNNREKAHSIKAYFDPLSPKSTGESIHFNSDKSSAGIWGGELQFFWDFGDGHSSFLPSPMHAYGSPGIFPVTLIVCDGKDNHAYRQFITIDGPETVKGSFEIYCENEPSFRKSKVWKTLVHDNVIQPKNTVHFYANFLKNNDEKIFTPKVVTLYTKNFQWTENPIKNYRIEPLYIHGDEDWLDIKTSFHLDSIQVEITPNADKLKMQNGFYEGYLLLHHESSMNSPAILRIVAEIVNPDTNTTVIVDDSGTHCISSDYFWLKPEFRHDWAKGYTGHFLINKDNSNDEYVRFMLNVTDGNYKISLHGEPFLNGMLVKMTGGFYVLVKHKYGIDKKWIEPINSLEIGNYDLSPGDDNYVEIITDHSKGLIIVDAIKLERQYTR